MRTAQDKKRFCLDCYIVTFLFYFLLQYELYVYVYYCYVYSDDGELTESYAVTIVAQKKFYRKLHIM